MFLGTKRKKARSNTLAHESRCSLDELKKIGDPALASDRQVRAAIDIMTGFEKMAMRKMATGYTQADYAEKVEPLYHNLEKLLFSDHARLGREKPEHALLGIIMEGRIAAFLRRRYLLPDNSVRSWVETDYRRYEQVYTYAIITAAMVERLLDFYDPWSGQADRELVDRAIEAGEKLIPKEGLDWIRAERFEGCVWDDWKEIFIPQIPSLMRDIAHHAKWIMHDQDGWSLSLLPFFPETLKDGLRKRMVAQAPDNRHDKEFTPRTAESLESREKLTRAPGQAQDVAPIEDPNLKKAFAFCRDHFGDKSNETPAASIFATAQGEAFLAWPGGLEDIIEGADLGVAARQLQRRFKSAGLLSYNAAVVQGHPVDGDPVNGIVVSNGKYIFGPAPAWTAPAIVIEPDTGGASV